MDSLPPSHACQYVTARLADEQDAFMRIIHFFMIHIYHRMHKPPRAERGSCTRNASKLYLLIGALAMFVVSVWLRIPAGAAADGSPDTYMPGWLAGCACVSRI